MTHIRKILAVAATTSMIASAAFGWGGIAVDDGIGTDHSDVGYGIVTKSPSRQAAATDALETCTSEGNSGCELVLTFQNCGAYAASKVVYGTGTAATQGDAEKRALTDCGDKDCRIVISDCE